MTERLASSLFGIIMQQTSILRAEEPLILMEGDFRILVLIPFHNSTL
ncbi:hypothetical protein [Nostoc sp. NOS(2021)]|nr:hypothetical protein [Nostoc sp. NOS(2021)]